ncbi:MAG: SoxR reducing system RseC family protein [Clostridia bacterium]|nr:SoxR reducing system RseC family protein [Clostridia bacterium]
MLRVGTVVASEGGQLTVLFERPEACQKCGACGGGRHGHRITLADPAGTTAVGDRVSVDMPEARVVSASALAYLIPLGGLLAGLMGGAGLAERVAPGMSPDLFAGLCALAGVAVSLPALWLADRAIRGKARWTPQIVEILPAGRRGQEKAEAP